MKLEIYQIDSFTDKLFGGNPAAVCPLSDNWLDDSLMRNIAMENNLTETAFYLEKNGVYHIRWFTPSIEVDLCGHATLAAAYVLFNIKNFEGGELIFHSRSGKLIVKKEDDYLTMNFPIDSIRKIKITDEIKSCFNIAPIDAYEGKTDYMLIFENEKQIKEIKYDLREINKLNTRGVIITAKGEESDFVSRFFAPQSGIDEDPVTGSAHTTLTPYWSKILNKKELKAIQLSKRGGVLICRNMGDRVDISGKAGIYMTGEIYV